MAEEKSLIRPTDDDARQQARILLRGARFAALAALEPGTGDPFASRVLLGTDHVGTPIILASRLAVHTQAILKDPRCSLLVGEPGKGDPLAWPRLTIMADATPVSPDDESADWLRKRFLRRHPKAALYAGFSDFSFYRLVPKRANLNGGFGKAYVLEKKDLLISSPLSDVIMRDELHLISQICALAEHVPDRLAALFNNEKSTGWEFIGLDPEGFELGLGNILLRVEFGAGIDSVNSLLSIYYKKLN
jgi:hypothetical protein